MSWQTACMSKTQAAAAAEAEGRPVGKPASSAWTDARLEHGVCIPTCCQVGSLEQIPPPSYSWPPSSSSSSSSSSSLRHSSKHAGLFGATPSTSNQATGQLKGEAQIQFVRLLSHRKEGNSVELSGRFGACGKAACLVVGALNSRLVACN